MKECSVTWMCLRAQAVTCTAGSAGVYGDVRFTVQIEKFPTFPYQNNFFYHDGNPSISAFECDVSDVRLQFHSEASSIDPPFIHVLE